jgi:anaerobic selenocysteine-containing dehydrogenase
MNERTHYRACNLCEAICGLKIEVKGREIVSLRGDEADPLSRGHICPKAVALRDLQEDPDRLRRPMCRTGNSWKEMGWDEAFDFVADRLAEIAREHGGDAVAFYLGNPNVHNYGAITHLSRLIREIRTRNRYSATSVDQLPHQLVAHLMFGHQLLLPIPDIDRTDYFLMLGANPMVSNGSLMTVPDFPKRLKALQARGGRMVVLDPRRTETAALADAHHFVRPGTDAAFLIGVLKTIFDEGLARPGRLASFTDGLASIEREVRAFDLGALAAHCEIGPEAIRGIARAFATAPRACAYGRIGVSIQRFGTLSQWLINLLNLVTGNLDREGGVLFTRPAVDMIESPVSRPGHWGKWKSRVRGLPEFSGELPVSALAEEITTPGEGRVRALVTVAGNPVLSTPNGAHLERAISQLDFMAAIDFYRNETTRLATVILPPTTALEHDHYDVVFHTLAVRNTARYSEPLFEKPEGALHDWEIFEALGDRLAKRLGNKREPFPQPEQVIDMGLQSGPYGAMRGHPMALSLERLRAAPHGIDLGPLQPCLPERLRLDGKRIRSAPAGLLEELGRFAAGLREAPEPDGALLLIGRRDLRSNNSWMHNYARLVKGPARHRLLVHPEDLAARGLRDGAKVVLRSRTGQVVVEAEACEDMMRGVVSLPHGWGHHREGVLLGIAREHAGASLNDVTDETLLDCSGNAALSGVRVAIAAAG